MQNPYQSYRQKSIQTASPGKLILMLYDGLIRFFNQARSSLEKGDLEAANNFLLRAQDIITELDADLNMEFEISGHLRKIYHWLHQLAVQANIDKDAAAIDHCLQVCAELRQAWTQVVENQGQERRHELAVDLTR